MERISRDSLEKLKEGDHNAFVEIYDACHKGVYIFVNKYIKNPMASEDIVHEVFLKLWNVKSRIDPDRPFLGYLYRIARNATYKELKKRMLQAPLESLTEREGDYPAHASSEDIYQEKEYEILLEKAVNSLPPQRQKVFILCRQQGKTYNEVASQLSISPYTVKEHMSLAMRSIEGYMKEKAGLSLSRGAFLTSVFFVFFIA